MVGGEKQRASFSRCLRASRLRALHGVSRQTPVRKRGKELGVRVIGKWAPASKGVKAESSQGLVLD